MQCLIQEVLSLHVQAFLLVRAEKNKQVEGRAPSVTGVRIPWGAGVRSEVGSEHQMVQVLS